MKTKNIDDKLDNEIRLFLSSIEKKSRKNLLKGKQITFDEFLNNIHLIVIAIQTGIPFPIFELIREKSTFTLAEFAKYLDTSTKTINRYKLDKKSFKPIHSEKIIEIAEVVELGYDIFDSEEQFKQWLRTPNYALRSSRPMDLLKDSYGKEMVIGELTRIDHGIFA